MNAKHQLTAGTGSESCNKITKGGGWEGRSRFSLRKILVSGKPHFYGHPLGRELFAATSFDRISDAGWIQVTSVGNENLYFNFKTDSGEVLPGYCKCL